MKTADLIATLAAENTAVNPAAVAQRFYLKLATGAILAVAFVVLVLGVRADLPAVAQLPMFWMKLLFPASLAAAGLVALRRLSYPGMRLGRAPAAAAIPLTVVWMLAGAALLAAPEGTRLPMVFGQTWLECPISITLLSVPALALAFWATRQLAPTRLSLAGAAAGLFAGAVAAFAYAIHCPEAEAPFLAVWYVLGMLIPTGAGALLGRRLLRW